MSTQQGSIEDKIIEMAREIETAREAERRPDPCEVCTDMLISSPCTSLALSIVTFILWAGLLSAAISLTVFRVRDIWQLILWLLVIFGTIIVAVVFSLAIASQLANHERGNEIRIEAPNPADTPVQATDTATTPGDNELPDLDLTALRA